MSASASFVDARTGLREEAAFLGAEGDRVFAVRHHPASPALGGVVICSPYFAELHTNYRREVLLARSLAAAGVGVVRFHPRGFGNSDLRADHDYSLDDSVTDAAAVADWLGELVPGLPTIYLGTGLAALVACSAAARSPGSPIALVTPVMSGRRYFREMFRARMIATARRGGHVSASTADLVAALEAGEAVDVMGFRLPASVYRTAQPLQLVELLPGDTRPMLVAHFGDRASQTELVGFAETARTAGFDVDLQLVEQDGSRWYIPDNDWKPEEKRVTTQQINEITRTWTLRQLEGAR